MSENSNGDGNIPTIVPTTATTPVFGTNFDNGPTNVSWEVSDGKLEDEKPPEPEKPEHEEKPEEPELEGEEDSSDEDEAEPKKKRNRVPYSKRIADLNRRLKQTEQLTAQVIAEKDYHAKQAEYYKQASDKNYENVIKNSISTLEEKLAQAIEDGDSKSQAHINTLLAQYSAEDRMIQKNKGQSQDYAPQVQQPQYQQPRDNYEINDDHPYADVGEEWARENSWADPDSKDFDREMYEAADDYSLKLIKQYRFEKRGDEIGSPEFFEEINDHIKDTYGIRTRSPKPKVKERLQMKEGNTTVSSVNRPSANAETTQKRGEIMLTAEEREAAHALRGFIRDSSGRKVTDLKQCEEIYKRNVRR